MWMKIALNLECTEGFVQNTKNEFYTFDATFWPDLIYIFTLVICYRNLIITHWESKWLNCIIMTYFVRRWIELYVVLQVPSCNSGPQICLSCPPIAECIQEKYWVCEKGFGLFWVQLGIDFFFFKGSVQSWSCVIPYDCQSTGKMHTHTQTTHVHVARRCENATSQHQQNIQREDQSEETSDTQVQVILPFFCISLPFSMAQQLCSLHCGLAKSVVKATWRT